MRDLGKLNEQSAEELTELVKRLAAIASLKQESNSIEGQLKTMLQRHRWLSEFERIDENNAGRIIALVTELIAVAEQATSLSWVATPISHSSLSKFVIDASGIAESATDSIAELAGEIQRQRVLEADIKRLQESADLLAQLRRFVEANVPDRLIERDNCEKDIALGTSLLSGYDSDAFSEAGIASETDLDADLGERYLEIRNAGAAAQDALQKTRREYARFTKLRQESLTLAQELRSIAGRIIEGQHTKDECPLCHSVFAKGPRQRTPPQYSRRPIVSI
jgi:exonuclease SbcC